MKKLLALLFINFVTINVFAQTWTPLPGDMQHIRTPQSDGTQLILPQVIRKIPMENVEFYAKRRAQYDTGVAFSQDGQLLAIGSFWGTLRVVNIYSGTVILNANIGEGMIKHLAFSPDNKTLYFGEQTVDANITAIDLSSGKALWKFRMADDLKTSPPPEKDDIYGVYRLPGCYRLKVLDNGDVIALGIHSWGVVKDYRRMQRLSRVYRLSPQGKLKWAFPSDGPIKMSLIYMDIDPSGRRAALLSTITGSNTPNNYPYQTETMYVLNGTTGLEIGRYKFQPLKPHFKQVGFWQSISINAKGTRAAIGMYDGRTFIFDLDTVKSVQQFGFGTPVMISNTPVSANATYTHMAADDMAYFQTGNSSVPNLNSMRHIVAPPGPHPNANTINAVGPDNRVKWRYKSGHVYQNFWSSDDGRWVLTMVKKEDQQTGREAGAILFDTHRSGGGSAKKVYFYQFEGMSYFQAAIAYDGSAIAMVEIPYKDSKSGKVIGNYQVHVVR